MGKKKKKTGHQMGKYCGCHVLDDGAIQVAPGYKDKINEILLEREAIQIMTEQMMGFLSNAHKAQNKRKAGLLKDMKEDYEEFWPPEPTVYEFGIIRTKPESEELE